jgi:hypothetical protein
MKTEVERKTAKALDLLTPSQITAWVGGSRGMGDRIRNHPHPRKTNAAARGNNADTYEMVLQYELVHELTRRDPEKARKVAQEMRWSPDPELVTMAHILEEHLDTSV